MNYLKLFNHLYDEHGITLLESELREIVLIVEQMKEDKSAVSCGFTDNEIKHIMYYGHTKDKRFFLDDENSALDYWIEDLFRTRGTEWDKTQQIFEKIFWQRIRNLVENSRQLPYIYTPPNNQ